MVAVTRQVGKDAATDLRHHLLILWTVRIFAGVARAKRRGYCFSRAKADELYRGAKSKLAPVHKSDVARTLVKEAVVQLNAVSRTVETYRSEMSRLESQLPEYETVMGLYGAGDSTGPQLIAEISDIRRFARQKSLVSFAGANPVRNESGDSKPKSAKASKRGSPYLCKTLFIIMTVLL
ncbi:MAG: IS110 family transposase [Oscillibacter sp.]|nr:IS110 family transposase [Oscillibacter sp.]